MIKQIFLLCFIFLWFSAMITAQENHTFFGTESVKQRIKKDIYVLASDSFLGRRTGTKGELLAADYIISELKKAGIQPFFGDTSYRQPFNLNLYLSFPHEHNYLELDYIRYYPGYDYFPVVYSSNDSLIGELYYVKYGITAPSLNYDDYKDLTGLKEKTFVIELSLPEGFKKNSKFLEYSSLSYKIDNAIKHGAAAVIFINSDDSYPYEPKLLPAGYKTYPLPVIYFAKNAQHIIKLATANKRVKLKTEILKNNSGTGYNISGYINNKASNTIIIGGHYDHLGKGGEGSRSPGSKQIHYGADDNASGTAGVLEMARYLKVNGSKKYNYIFVAFSAEEIGLKGSEYFIRSDVLKNYQVDYMIDLDMIGRIDSTKKEFEIWGTGSSRAWKKILSKLPSASNNVRLVNGLLRDSDHYPFYMKHIPVLMVNSGLHRDYHRPSDQPEKINYIGEAEIIVYLEDLLKATESQDKIKFKRTGVIANFKAVLRLIKLYIDISV